jgi:hypothetical protein
MRKRSVFLLAILSAAPLSYAHHGTNSQFDQSQSLEVSGVITELRFVNPHSYVYFDVTNESGGVEKWRCEMRAATVLKRSGWSEDMFKPGTRIYIEGAPARREAHGCYVERLRLDDGEFIRRYDQIEDGENEVALEDRPATLPNGQPNISGDWAAPQRRLNDGETLRRAPGGFRGTDYMQSDAGREASAGHAPDRDNPRFHCQPVNIIADWVFDQHINRIVQLDKTITLTYGFMDIVRTIHLDMDEHPDDIKPTRVGHSIGRWEGNTLVVDTIGFLPGYLDGRFGIKHSDQLHIVERFQLVPDQSLIIREYVGEDPLYLTESFSSQDNVFLSATPFDPYNCDDLTSETLDGN